MLPALNPVTRRQKDDSSDSPFIWVLCLRLWTRRSNKWLLITRSFQLIHFLIFFFLSVILNCVFSLSTPPVLLRLYFRIILCFHKDISPEAHAALVKIRWHILKHKHFSRNLNFYFSILLLATNLTQLSQLTRSTLWFHRSLMIHKKAKAMLKPQSPPGFNHKKLYLKGGFLKSEFWIKSHPPVGRLPNKAWTMNAGKTSVVIHSDTSCVTRKNADQAPPGGSSQPPDRFSPCSRSRSRPCFSGTFRSDLKAVPALPLSTWGKSS